MVVRLSASLRRGLFSAFGLVAMLLAAFMHPLHRSGLAGDAFVAASRVVGTGPAVLGFALVMLGVVWGMTLWAMLAIRLAVGVPLLVRDRVCGTRHAHFG